jgi:hypothetical protein
MRVEVNKDYSFDEDQYLFKYIDIHKLIYLLYSENLFFSPLSYFDDPLEGISQEALNSNHANIIQQCNDNDDNQHNKILQDDEKAVSYNSYLEKVQKQLFASCWFLGTRESLAMWENYSNNDSVALRFKPDYLCNHMISNFTNLEDPNFDLMAHGKVEYFKLSPLDPNDETLKNSHHKFPGFIKDLSYKHEEEFRFLLMQQHMKKQYSFFEFSPGPLKELDFDIITHPYMEDWKFKNIQTILSNLKLANKLQKSAIPIKRQKFLA